MKLLFPSRKPKPLEGHVTDKLIKEICKQRSVKRAFCIANLRPLEGKPLDSPFVKCLGMNTMKLAETYARLVETSMARHRDISGMEASMGQYKDVFDLLTQAREAMDQGEVNGVKTHIAGVVRVVKLVRVQLKEMSTEIAAATRNNEMVRDLCVVILAICNKDRPINQY